MSDWGGDDSWDFSNLFDGGGDLNANDYYGSSGDELPSWGNEPGAFNWDQLLSGVGSGGGSGWGSSLASIFKAITGGGNGGIASLLPFLAAAGGGLYTKSSTNKANDYMQQAIKDANAQITGMYDKNSASWAPWQQMGTDAMAKIQAMPDANLAAKFGNLAGNYKPLGSGKGISLKTMAKG